MVENVAEIWQRMWQRRVTGIVMEYVVWVRIEVRHSV